jgi:hypothetical protein
MAKPYSSPEVFRDSRISAHVQLGGTRKTVHELEWKNLAVSKNKVCVNLRSLYTGFDHDMDIGVCLLKTHNRFGKIFVIVNQEDTIETPAEAWLDDDGELSGCVTGLQLRF